MIGKRRTSAAGGAVNPTLTIAALSPKAADHTREDPDGATGAIADRLEVDHCTAARSERGGERRIPTLSESNI